MAWTAWIVYHCVAVILVCVCLIPPSIQQSDQPSSTPGVAVSDGLTDTDSSSLAKGVEPLYEMTNVFLGKVVQPHRINDYFNISVFFDGSFFTSPQDNWKPLASYFVGFVVCGVIGVLFIIVMPIVGLVFCCCRCCGRCGGKAGSHDPKSAKCKRVSYGIILIVINTLTLAAVVCLFFTNELIHIQSSENGAVSKIQKNVESLQKYINESYTGLQYKTLSLYDEKIWSPSPALGQGLLIQEINDTAAGAVDEVLRQLNVTVALDKSKELARDVNKTLDSLLDVERSLESLSDLGNHLRDSLIALKGQIEHELQSAECKVSLCDSTVKTVTSLKVDANFTQLDRLGNISAKVRNETNVQAGIDAADSTVTDLKNSAKNNVQTQVGRAEAIARNIRDDIADALNSVESQLKQVNLPETTQRSIDDARKDAAEFGKYWWYAGIGISCLCLLIVIFYYFGLMYGFCGERPGEDAQCCNRGVGANLLMAGVGFSFLFSWLLMVVTIILFIPGGVVFTEVCRYTNTHNPEDLRVLDPLSDLIGLSRLYNNTDKPLTLATILRDCRNDTGIYQALQLNKVFDLEKYLDLTNLDNVLDDISAIDLQVDNLTVPQKLLDELRNFGESGFETINITQYKSQIESNLTSVDLYQLAGLLEDVGKKLTEGTTPGPHSATPARDLSDVLHAQAAQLRNISDTTVVQMKAEVAILSTAINNLETKMDMKRVTEELIRSIKQAEENFNTNGRGIINQRLPEETARVKSSVKAFTQEVYVQTTTEVGRCRPVYDAVYGASDVACLDVLNPLNGFWFSLGWCLFFFIPSIIFAVKLAGLYRKEDEYVAGIRNSDEVPEIYSNGETHSDTIPLTSMSKPGRQETNGGLPNSGYHRDEFPPKASYDRHGYVDGPRHYAAGDGYYPEARRYPTGGYEPQPRGYHGYPNGMSSSGYPGPPLDPPFANY